MSGKTPSERLVLSTLQKGALNGYEKLLKHALEEYTSHGKHAKFDHDHKRSKRYKYDDDDDRRYSYDKRYKRHEYADDRYRYAHNKHSHGKSLLSDPRIHSLAATLFQAARQMLRSKGRKY